MGNVVATTIGAQAGKVEGSLRDLSAEGTVRCAAAMSRLTPHLHLPGSAAAHPAVAEPTLLPHRGARSARNHSEPTEAKEPQMPRVIVTADPVSSQITAETPVLLDEQVRSVHLSTDHAASQLVERLAWAIRDAEDADRVRVARTRS